MATGGEPDILRELVRAFSQNGLDLPRLGRAWARAAPCVAIVPAFGLRALPGPARAVFALVLAAAIVPTLPALAVPSALDGPYGLSLLLEALHGVTVGVATALPLWVATMAGGLVDSLRGATESTPSAWSDGRATPSAHLFGLLAAPLFLAWGGASRLVSALLMAPQDSAPIARVAHLLAESVALALALASPVFVVAIVLEVTFALVARLATPAHVGPVVAPLRSVAMLAIVAIMFDRVAGMMAAMLRGS